MQRPSPSAKIITHRHLLLYLNCMLTDFAVFLVVFTISRGLAERGAEPLWLGTVGAGFSFCAAVGSIVGSWLAHRIPSSRVFVGGAAATAISIALCTATATDSGVMIAAYWLLGIGLGLFYPPLIGWLNEGEDIHTNRRGISRTLILFCLAWNFGMLCGQLTAGMLFSWGAQWAYRAALLAAAANVLIAGFAARQVLRHVVLSPAVATPPEPPQPLANSFKRLSWIANLGGMFGGSMMIHLLPDLAVSIGVPASQHGTLLAYWRAVIIATYLAMHWLAFWHFRFSTAVVSQLLGAAGLVVVALANNSFTLLVGLVLLGQLVGYNYFSGLFYSTAGSQQSQRTMAAGIHEATLAVGMAIGTIVGGALGSWFSFRLPYALAAAVLLAGLVAQSAAWWAWVGSLRSSPAPSPDCVTP